MLFRLVVSISMGVLTSLEMPLLNEWNRPLLFLMAMDNQPEKDSIFHCVACSVYILYILTLAGGYTNLGGGLCGIILKP